MTCGYNSANVVSMDVPLLIRLLEYAREDAETDMDLHYVAENLVALGIQRGVLLMEDYDEIIHRRKLRRKGY